MYEDGNTRQNILLQAGDVVNVPARQFNKIFVLGSVNDPGSYIMNKRRKTLAEALGDAGDIDQFIANAHQIFVLRGGQDIPEIYHLNSETPDALLLADRFPLRARDVVFVDEADLVRWNKLLALITPTTNEFLKWGNTSYPLFNKRSGN